MIPLHYTDSCIFFEVFSISKEKLRQMARKYFYDVNKEHQGVVSSLSLGEITDGLLELPLQKDREDSFFNISQHLKNFKIVYPKFEDYQLALELRSLYYNLEPADALHLAMAVTNKVQVFMTLGERKLVDNPILEKFCRERGLKIKILGA